MGIEAGFQLRLDLYGIDAEVRAARQEIWKLLEPRLHRILQQNNQKYIDRAPAFKDKPAEVWNKATALNFEYTKRLLVNDFNEQWVQDAYDRLRKDAELGFDLRIRAGVWQTILQEFGKIVLHKYWFSAAKAVRIIDAASRLMVLDVQNAIFCDSVTNAALAKRRAEDLAVAIDEFSKTVHGLRVYVTSAVTQLAATSSDLSVLSESALLEVNTGVQAAKDTASRVTKIAAATEELTASIGEIHSNASNSANRAHLAAAQAIRAKETITQLSDVADKIGSVIGLITDVAEQTNLLALNATIEAARAGNAGRGFAVVAAEVKNLASETSKATAEIEPQISLIQEQTRRSVGEIKSIGATVGEIAEMAKDLAERVSDQASATREISEGASGSAQNATTLHATFGGVEETVENTRKTAQSVLEISNNLAASTAQVEKAIDTLIKDAGRASFVQPLTDISVGRSGGVDARTAEESKRRVLSIA